jgi:uncharacterized protein YjbI with pentapeptide repeats
MRLIPWITLFMEIKNSQGEIIFQCDGDFRKADLDDIDLSGAMLENANLEGVVWCGTNLSRANLKAADFYWAILFTSNFSYADLQEAQFRGADLKEVNFQGANLMKANFGRDNLGGSTQLQGANLSQAQTRDAIFEGAEYDTRTVFPELFDPTKEGMCFRPVLSFER